MNCVRTALCIQYTPLLTIYKIPKYLGNKFNKFTYQMLKKVNKLRLRDCEFELVWRAIDVEIKILFKLAQLFGVKCDFYGLMSTRQNYAFNRVKFKLVKSCFHSRLATWRNQSKYSVNITFVDEDSLKKVYN